MANRPGNAPTITRLDVRLAVGDRAVDFWAVQRSGSPIHRHGLLVFIDEPRDYVEIGGLHRVDDGTPAGLQSVLSVLALALPLVELVADGRCVLMLCGPTHAPFWVRMFARRGWHVTVLRGSMRDGNPYPPLVCDGPTGGSDDEHILMMEHE